MGLNELYNTTGGNLLMKVPLPYVNQAYHALLEEERQQDITDATVEPKASTMASFNKKFEQGFNNRFQLNDYQKGE